MQTGQTTVLRKMPASRRAVFSGMLVCLVLIAGAGATYAGDRPLAVVYSGDTEGGYIYDTGTSVYTSSLTPGSGCNATFNLTLPAGSTVDFSRLYVYWAWSRLNQKALYPVFTVTDSRDPDTPLNLSARYVDSKGFVSTYDFYSGTDAYGLNGISPGENRITVNLSQDGPDGSSVLVFGMAALVVYRSPAGERQKIWVAEGCDLLFSSYGISPDMASSSMVFDGEVDKTAVKDARLFLVAPSGGYSRDLAIGINALLVNRVEDDKTPPLISTIFSLLFPTYKGKEWDDIFDMDPTTQIGFETKEVRPYLRTDDNRVIIRDQGDYLQLSNAVLTIRQEGDS